MNAMTFYQSSSAGGRSFSLKEKNPSVNNKTVLWSGQDVKKP